MSRWEFVPEQLYQGQHVGGRTCEVWKDGKCVARVFHATDAQFIVAACNREESYLADQGYRERLERKDRGLQ
jgi:hypothetical protein